MAAPMGQGRWEPILEPIDWSGIAFVILFGKTDDYERNKGGGGGLQPRGDFSVSFIVVAFQKKCSEDERHEGKTQRRELSEKNQWIERKRGCKYLRNKKGWMCI